MLYFPGLPIQTVSSSEIVFVEVLGARLPYELFVSHIIIKSLTHRCSLFLILTWNSTIHAPSHNVFRKYTISVRVSGQSFTFISFVLNVVLLYQIMDFFRFFLNIFQLVRLSVCLFICLIVNIFFSVYLTDYLSVCLPLPSLLFTSPFANQIF